MHPTEDGYDTSYPRPQMVREEWADLCGEWEFRYDDDDVGLRQHWFDGDEPFDRVIVVPFPPESALSGIGDTGHHPVVWYRRTFSAPGGERSLLNFGAVDYRAEVWVDGLLVVSHEGGNTPFSADVTEVLRRAHAPGAGLATAGTAAGNRHAVHTVVVRAEDRPTDATQPRGKQDWRVEPHKIWYHRTTGIWQPVWLEPVPDLHLAYLAWTPDPAAGMVRLEVELNRYPVRAASVQVTLSLHGEVIAEQSWRVAGVRASLKISVPALAQGQDRERLLWTPERPNLVRAVVTVVDADRSAVDDRPELSWAFDPPTCRWATSC